MRSDRATKVDLPVGIAGLRGYAVIASNLACVLPLGLPIAFDRRPALPHPHTWTQTAEHPIYLMDDEDAPEDALNLAA